MNRTKEIINIINAKHVADKYEFISKIDFFKEVKDITTDKFDFDLKTVNRIYNQIYRER